ncbi:MAG TPA: hypothetical protein VHC68_00830 [Candidatus Paceibacterota bacterium]|nr:hypothetical protein [Candidatus Paceibacterota bacterium]
MSTKGAVWAGLFIGSTAGGLLPSLWGGGAFASMLWSTLGAVAGIWAGFKLAQG